MFAPVLAFIRAFFSGWLAKVFTKYLGAISHKGLVIGSTVAASLALTAALAVFITGLLAGVVAVAPDWVATGAFFLPSNTGGCISALVVAKTARWVYGWKITNLFNASKVMA